jgi:HipA-like protein
MSYKTTYRLDYTKVIGVKVFLENYSKRIFVGELKQENDKYIFEYDKKYLNYQKAIPLGPELPLTKGYFESPKIFESFWDRIPSKDNSAYTDYCKQFNISPEEDKIMILLTTIGKQGPSSFVFEPIWSDSFSRKDLKSFRKTLGLSTRDFASSFGISQATIVRIENNKASGLEVLKFLEILYNFPEAAIYYIEKHGAVLHSKIKERLCLQLFSGWADVLTEGEVIVSKVAKAILELVPWGDKMLKDTSSNISINQLFQKLEEERASLNKEFLITAKSKLFEVRFALAIKLAGLAAIYEDKNVGSSSVDFKVYNAHNDTQPTWLIELTSLRDSQAVKENTIIIGNFSMYSSNTNSWDKLNSPEVRDIIKTQDAILNKVTKKTSDGLQPIKFPLIEKKTLYIHVIIVDIRAFNAGASDFGDYINILYGSKDLPDEYKRWWKNKNEIKEPIIGIFDPNYPDSRSKYLQQRVHAVGFIYEKSFMPGELNSSIVLYANTKSNTENIRKLWHDTFKAKERF